MPNPVKRRERLILFRSAAGLMLLCLLAQACTNDGFRDGLLREAGQIVADGGTDDPDAGPVVQARCTPAIASEALPPRQALMQGGGASAGSSGVYIADLFGTFKTQCGDCHADGRNNGGFDVKVTNFAEKISQDVLARIRSEDPDLVMPRPVPGGPSRFSERTPDDPVVRFAALIEEWLAEGKPPVFYPASNQGGAEQLGDSPYVVSAEVGSKMTNLGNCVPTAKMVSGDKARTRAAELDAAFAAMTRFEDLPKSLRDTDVSTLDAEQLAEHGVYAFAPAYTLWADDAKKIRFVRVPVGKSITFDKDGQSFHIPPNTRFYKTFLKRVVDLHGNARYRKMETRLIVARPDPELADGEDYAPTALFASYKWNEEETEATLVDEPYRDGTGFADDLQTYVVDERLEDQILREEADDLERMLEVGARRSYAIPGADRCIHCHMGAPDRSFVLGFIPLQINRRQLGVGGVIEPAEQHELDQLDRLIAYGVISGMTSPADVVPLEKSQAEREPRNEHELAAQGYMLGNCAHCHNPLGFPSLREKVLADVLDFLPSRTGGIFQFPLDKFSPRTFRGPDQNILTPYITPSLFDHPIALQANQLDGGGVSRQGLKWIVRDVDSAESEPFTDLFASLAPLTQTITPGRPLLAPWRSLIYRNVDAPFSYEDGATIFPHMPMDTPGYDCRARRLLGSWMASIPARLGAAIPGDIGEMASAEDQPYLEVTSDDSDYERYQSEAEERLQRFQNGERFHDCPAPELDPVAPEVANGVALLPKAQLSAVYDAEGNKVGEYWLQSAARSHYPKTDLRDDRTWIIRRDDWFKVLVENGVDDAKEAKGGPEAEDSRRAIATVRQLMLSDSLREFALTELPFGLWLRKESCAEKLAAQPKVADFAGEARPRWMDAIEPEAAAPVFMASPGAQVFSMVCTKCHGPDATGKSTLASTIAELTGGLTRVANLRDGLLGPPGGSGVNRQEEFGQADGRLNASAEDWVARYMVWMGLGGTNAAIPKTVLTQIGSASVLGASRMASLGTIDAKSAANMLGIAKEACSRLIPTANVAFDALTGRLRRTRELDRNGRPLRGQVALEEQGLIPRNGDLELWQALCRFDNPQPVRVLDFHENATGNYLRAGGEIDPSTNNFYKLYHRTSFPADAPIGDHDARVVTGLHSNNLEPWCLGPFDPSFAGDVAAVESLKGEPLPRCPDAFLNDPKNQLTQEEGALWAARGAANAGLAVYLYLDALAKGEVKPKPAYDKCEEL